MRRQADSRTCLDMCSQHCVAGIDMSLNNPGVCILKKSLRHIHFYFVRNRLKDTTAFEPILNPDSIFDNWMIFYHCLEHDSSNSSLSPQDEKQTANSRASEYSARIKQLVAVLHVHRPDVVAIENYSFHASGSSASKLYELGGCLRMFLNAFHYPMVEYSPTQVKKQFTGRGNATKSDMYRVYTDTYKMPDMYPTFSLRSDQSVPHPIEDLVDSFAVVMTHVQVRAS